MLFPCKQVVPKYKSFIAKMSKDIENEAIISNLQKLLDLELILGLHYILLFLELVHTLIKYAQGRDVYTCDFVEEVKMWRTKLYELYIDPKCNSKMKLLMHSIVFWLENVMGCLCFSLSHPPLLMIGVLQSSMVTLF
jgi:hypothetical protein